MRPSAARHLLRRGRFFAFRCRLPRPLATSLGRSALVISLRTGDEALARVLVQALALRMPALWQLLRETGQRLDRDQTLRLLRAWMERELDRVAAAFAGLDRESPEAWARQRQLYRGHAEGRLDNLIEDHRAGDFTSATLIAREIARQATPPLHEKSHAFTRLCEDVMVAEGLLLEAQMRWAEGKPASTPPMPEPGMPWPPRDEAPAVATPAKETPPPAAEIPSPDAAAAPRTLAEAIDLYVELRSRDRKMTAKQAIDLQGKLRLLTEAFGAGRPVGSITEQDAGRLVEWLHFLPKHFRQHPVLADLSLEEKAARARELKLEPLNARRSNAYLDAFRGLFSAEKKFGRIAANPFMGKSVDGAVHPKKDRAFTWAELEALFATPLFQGCRAERRPHDRGGFLIDDWRFWAPVIAMLSGARIGEIAQLRPQDIRTENEVWLIDINDAEGRRLKTDAARRLIPVHPDLVRLGLLELAARRCVTQQARLLPDIPKPVLGDPGKQPSKWMSEKFLVKHGMKRPLLGFHSFRHTMRTLLREVRMEERYADYMFGHYDPATAGVYGDQALRNIAEDLARIRVPEALKSMPSRAPSGPVTEAENSDVRRADEEDP